MVRAALADVNAGSAVQGGSTIAQQLVKTTYLTDQKTLDRKIREAVLAERLEEKYSKSQILDAYLNLVYLGSGAYGVEAASKEYFNEDADKVSLAQAALLAGLIQAPSGYDPLTNPVGARERRSQVLSRMVFYKSITPAQAAAANEVPLPTTVHDAPGVSYTSYGYYVDQVVNQLLDNPALGQTTDERYSALFTGGLKIYTNEEPPSPRSLPARRRPRDSARAIPSVAASGHGEKTCAAAPENPRKLSSPTGRSRSPAMRDAAPGPTQIAEPVTLLACSSRAAAFTVSPCAV